MKLADVKRNIAAKKKFTIISHIRPENIGQIRIPSKAQTNGFYSRIIDPKPHELRVNSSNHNLGSWLEYDHASDWEISADGLCTKYFRDQEHTPKNMIIQIKFLGE